MKETIDRCTKCILPSNFQNINFNDQGVCSYCQEYKKFSPKDKEKLLDIFTSVKKRNPQYDALVPLSGGKDSTYVLYLARKNYNLNVLTYTYDNGFLSPTAIENINNTVTRLNVDHIFIRPNFNLLKKLYRSVLMISGELCTICGIGIITSYLKLSEAYNIPLILTGDKVTETNTINFEKIYDIHRLQYILSQDPTITKQEINQFLIYPNLHPYLLKFYTYTGKFGRVLHPLFYQDLQNDEEIGKMLAREIGWIDAGKHADCIAEGLSNYIREHRYGYSRRVAYLSNKIRMGDIDREQALERLLSENASTMNINLNNVMEFLDLTDEDLDKILKVQTMKFQNYVYKQNRVVNKAIRIFEKFIDY